MTTFTEIEKVSVPKSLVDETQEFLRKVGKHGREGMVLWVGKADGNHFDVTTMLVPRQRGLKTQDGVCVVVDGDEMHRINLELYKTGLQLIAQIHSHPHDAYHSETDDEYALTTTEGTLSLVIPDFAVRSFDLEECAVYRLSKAGNWELVSPRRAKSLLSIEGD